MWSMTRLWDKIWTKRLDDYAIQQMINDINCSIKIHICYPVWNINIIIYKNKRNHWYDRLNFGWAVVEYESYSINYKINQDMI